MTRIYSSILDLIGGTPLLDLSHVLLGANPQVRLLCKVESFNPGGSVKDRAALSMVLDAEASGRLQPGSTIVEPTSGNTGVALAMIAAVRGYRLIVVMPETMSVERRRLMAAYGAEVVLTPGKEGTGGAVRRAEALCTEITGAVMLNQFDNPANPEAHIRTTAEEIWRDTEGQVDVLVAGVGTSGTLSGTGQRLKELNPALQVIAVEPKGSAVLSGGKAGPHGLQGIGAGFVPGNYRPEVVDEIVTLADAPAFDMARRLAAKAGLLVGISSGAAVATAVDLAQTGRFNGKTMVVILPDTGERYLSTSLFAPQQ